MKNRIRFFRSKSYRNHEHGYDLFPIRLPQFHRGLRSRSGCSLRSACPSFIGACLPQLDRGTSFIGACIRVADDPRDLCVPELLLREGSVIETMKKILSNHCLFPMAEKISAFLDSRKGRRGTE